MEWQEVLRGREEALNKTAGQKSAWSTFLLKYILPHFYSCNHHGRFSKRATGDSMFLAPFTLLIFIAFDYYFLATSISPQKEKSLNWFSRTILMHESTSVNDYFFLFHGFFSFAVWLLFFFEFFVIFRQRDKTYIFGDGIRRYLFFLRHFRAHVLFIPVIRILTWGMFYCSHDEDCDPFLNFFLIVFSVITMCFWIFPSILTAFFTMDINPLSHSLSKGFTTRLDVARSLVRPFFGILFMIPDLPQWMSPALGIFVYLCLTIFVLYRLPYYIAGMNALFTAFMSSLCLFSILRLVQVVRTDDDNLDPVVDVPGLFVFLSLVGIALICVLSFYVIRLRYVQVNNAITAAYKQAQHVEPDVEHSFRPQRQNGQALYESCRKQLLFKADIRFVLRSWHNDTSSHRIRLLQPLFSYAIKAHPSNYQLRVSQLLFVVCAQRSNETALKLLRRVSAMNREEKMPLALSYSLYCVSDLRSIYLARMLGDNSVDFKKRLEHADKFYYDVLERIRTFWVLLTQPDIPVDTLPKISEHILQSRKQASFLYSGIIRDYPSSSKVLRHYARFQRDGMMDLEGAVACMDALGDAACEHSDNDENIKLFSPGQLHRDRNSTTAANGGQKDGLAGGNCPSDPHGKLQPPHPHQPHRGALDTPGYSDESGDEVALTADYGRKPHAARLHAHGKPRAPGAANGHSQQLSRSSVDDENSTSVYSQASSTSTQSFAPPQPAVQASIHPNRNTNTHPANTSTKGKWTGEDSQADATGGVEMAEIQPKPQQGHNETDQPAGAYSLSRHNSIRHETRSLSAINEHSPPNSGTGTGSLTLAPLTTEQAPTPGPASPAGPPGVLVTADSHPYKNRPSRRCSFGEATAPAKDPPSAPLSPVSVTEEILTNKLSEPPRGAPQGPPRHPHPHGQHAHLNPHATAIIPSASMEYALESDGNTSLDDAETFAASHHQNGHQGPGGLAHRSGATGGLYVLPGENTHQTVSTDVTIPHLLKLKGPDDTHSDTYTEGTGRSLYSHGSGLGDEDSSAQGSILSDPFLSIHDSGSSVSRLRSDSSSTHFSFLSSTSNASSAEEARRVAQQRQKKRVQSSLIRSLFVKSIYALLVAIVLQVVCYVLISQATNEFHDAILEVVDDVERSTVMMKLLMRSVFLKGYAGSPELNAITGKRQFLNYRDQAEEAFARLQELHFSLYEKAVNGDDSTHSCYQNADVFVEQYFLTNVYDETAGGESFNSYVTYVEAMTMFFEEVRTMLDYTEEELIAQDPRYNPTFRFLVQSAGNATSGLIYNSYNCVNDAVRKSEDVKDRMYLTLFISIPATALALLSLVCFVLIPALLRVRGERQATLSLLSAVPHADVVAYLRSLDNRIGPERVRSASQRAKQLSQAQEKWKIPRNYLYMMLVFVIILGLEVLVFSLMLRHMPAFEKEVAYSGARDLAVQKGTFSSIILAFGGLPYMMSDFSRSELLYYTDSFLNYSRALTVGSDDLGLGGSDGRYSDLDDLMYRDQCTDPGIDGLCKNDVSLSLNYTGLIQLFTMYFEHSYNLAYSDTSLVNLLHPSFIELLVLTTRDMGYGLERATDLYTENSADWMDSFQSSLFMWIVGSVLFLSCSYWAILFPMLSKVQREHEHTMSLLLLLPPAVLEKTPQITFFLQTGKIVEVQNAISTSLAQSRHRVNVIMDAIVDYCVFLIDAEGKIRSVNMAAIDILGYTSKNDFLGQSLAMIFPSDSQRRRFLDHVNRSHHHKPHTETPLSRSVSRGPNQYPQANKADEKGKSGAKAGKPKAKPSTDNKAKSETGGGGNAQAVAAAPIVVTAASSPTPSPRDKNNSDKEKPGNKAAGVPGDVPVPPPPPDAEKSAEGTKKGEAQEKESDVNFYKAPLTDDEMKGAVGEDEFSLGTEAELEPDHIVKYLLGIADEDDEEENPSGEARKSDSTSMLSSLAQKQSELEKKRQKAGFHQKNTGDEGQPDGAVTANIHVLAKSGTLIPARVSIAGTVSSGERLHVCLVKDLREEIASREEMRLTLIEKVEERTRQLKEEQEKSTKLLYNMLPASIADTLRQGFNVVPQTFDNVTIFFSDICGFTQLSSVFSPVHILDMLNSLWTVFDRLTRIHGVHKIETIGDAFEAVSGAPDPVPDHAVRICNFAIDIQRHAKDFKMYDGTPIRIRIGIHSGPVATGVLGSLVLHYTLVGDTVNTASRMESSGAPERIHISATTFHLVNNQPHYVLEKCEPLDIKGKGIMQTYWLSSSAAGEETPGYLNENELLRKLSDEANEPSDPSAWHLRTEAADEEGEWVKEREKCVGLLREISLGTNGGLPKNSSHGSLVSETDIRQQVVSARRRPTGLSRSNSRNYGHNPHPYPSEQQLRVRPTSAGSSASNASSPWK